MLFRTKFMGETVALLDLGSNAARFVLARFDVGGGFRVVVEERVATKLGSGVRGLLPRRAIERTVLSASHFLERVERKNPKIVAIATSAVREAENRGELLEALAELGVRDVRVLTGFEEARLGAEAAMRTMTLNEGLIVDLGGGSVEVSRVRDGRIASLASLPMGCARLTKTYFRTDPPLSNEIRAARDSVKELFCASSASKHGAGPLVVLGGTVRALARLHTPRRADTHGTMLRAVDIARIREWLERMTIVEKRGLPGLKPDRADTILAGAIVLEELMAHGNHAVLVVSSASVREGVLHREARRFASEGSSVGERTSNRALPPLGFEPFRPEAR
jgi:exopolyphosphatase / guanosine-5'-triphosphate,3'-diphosphate pyrophosphatase